MTEEASEHLTRDGRPAARWDPEVETPPMRGEFDRARTGEQKKPKKAAVVKRELKLQPPAPKGMGGQAEPQHLVSPYLRERDAQTEREKEKARLRERLRMKREFGKASRDAFER